MVLLPPADATIGSTTVTLTVLLVEQPLVKSVTSKVYVRVDVGFALGLATLVADNPVLGDQA